MKKTVLLTGGCGYIGSHICYELLENDQYEVVIVDNFCNSTRDGIDRISKKVGKTVTIYEVDLRDRKQLLSIFQNHPIQVVIHLASLKSVKESTEKALEYFDNNVNGTQILLSCMKETGVDFLIFSSSACVYGDPQEIPVTEETSVYPINPYGDTKLQIETILQELEWGHFISLRYFNPIGAHPSGLIGDNPKGIPENLVPYVLKVAQGELEVLSVFGNDYQTKDGTAVRDYLHVVDLAQAHLKAMDYLLENHIKYDVFNLGTGQGHTVLDIINGFSHEGITINFQYAPRRIGDAEIVYANVEKANSVLQWKAKLGLTEMIRDSWRWAKANKDIPDVIK